MSPKKQNLWIFSILAVVFFSFNLWYFPSGGPLTPEEIEKFKQKGSQYSDRDDPSEIEKQKRILEFAMNDDGHSFYMVNLIRLREKSQYDESQPFSGTGIEANQRYGQAVIPLLLKRGSHPVFVTKVLQEIIVLGFDSPKWQQVAIVRYRSRRDLIEMATSEEFQNSAFHKWAAIESTLVIPTQGILFAPVPLIFGLFLIMIGMLTKKIWSVAQSNHR